MPGPVDDAIRPELQAALDRAWSRLARPGNWFDGAGRVALAEAARAAAAGDETAVAAEVSSVALDVAATVATAPASIDEAWVGRVTDELGEPPYLEIVGVVSRLAAVDTFHRLLGRTPPPLPRPEPGTPARHAPPEGLRRNHTWVAMSMPSPPFVLGAVPAEAEAQNDLSDELYMPAAEMPDPAWRRRTLHRTQMEVVATTVSHENECFY